MAKGDDKKNIIKLAYLYVQEGRWDEAVVEYQKLLELDPEDINIHNMLGDVYARKNDSANAYEQYMKVSNHLAKHEQPEKVALINKKIARLDGNKLSAEGKEKQKFIQLYIKADQAFEEDRIEEAVEAYNTILKMEPDDLTVISKLAELEEKLGRTSNAIEQYTRLGESFMKNHLFKKAQEMFKKVTVMDPSNIAARLSLAQIYTRQGSESDAKKEYLNIAEQALANKDLDGAFEYANKAVELKSIEAHYILGMVLFERQDWAKAKAEFEALLRFKVNHMGAMVYLAKVYDGMGQNDKAVETFQKILKSDKDNLAALEAWAEYCVKKKSNAEAMKSLTLLAEKSLSSGDYKRAIQFAEIMMKVEPDSIQPKLKLAGALEGSGDKNGAAEIYYNLSLLCENQNKSEEAAQYSKKALELNPAHVKTKNVKAEAVHSAPVEASKPAPVAVVVEAPKAVVVPVNPQEAFKAQLSVADLYVKQGLLDEAIDIYQQLLEMEPDNTDLKTKLNNVYTAYAKTGTDINNVAEDDFEMKAREEAEKKAQEAKEEAEKKAKAEADKKSREEAEKKAREEAEKKVREEAEKKAKEEAEKKARAEAEKKAREEAEEKVKIELEKRAREEAEKKAREEAEKKEREEAERKQKEEIQRIARENIERRDREAAEKKAKEEAEKKAREEAEKKAREEAEKKAREEAEQKAREEAEKKKMEEVQRIARENIERRDREAAEKKAKEEAERKAREEAERKIREEAERKAREEAEKKEREEAEKRAIEEAKRRAQAEAERKSLDEIQNKIREAVEKKTREQAEKREREKAEMEMEQKVREEVERKVREEMEKKRKEEVERKIREYVEKKVREDMEKRVAEEIEIKTKEELEKNYQEEEKKKAREEAKRKIREEMGKKANELTEMVAVAEADLLCNQDRYEDAVKMYKGFLDTHPGHLEATRKLKMAEEVLKAKAAKLNVAKAPSYLKVIESPANSNPDSDDNKNPNKIGYV